MIYKMKKNKAVLSILVLLFTNTSSFAQKIEEVKIGTQVWMSKNLNVDKFRNGDPIPEAKTIQEWLKASENKQPAWCYYDNIAANGEKYGRLYNWFAVTDPRGLAPSGWHVPTDAELTQLTDLFGGEFGGDKYSPTTGTKLKSTSGWKNNGSGTNESGFSALPAGGRDLNGIFNLIEEAGGLHCTSEQTTVNAWARQLVSASGYIFRASGPKGTGLSVRCVKD